MLSLSPHLSPASHFLTCWGIRKSVKCPQNEEHRRTNDSRKNRVEQIIPRHSPLPPHSSPKDIHYQVPDYNHFYSLQLSVKTYAQGEKKTIRKYIKAITGYTKMVELWIFFFYSFTNFP